MGSFFIQDRSFIVGLPDTLLNNLAIQQFSHEQTARTQRSKQGISRNLHCLLFIDHCSLKYLSPDFLPERHIFSRPVDLEAIFELLKSIFIEIDYRIT